MVSVEYIICMIKNDLMMKNFDFNNLKIMGRLKIMIWIILFIILSDFSVFCNLFVISIKKLYKK